MTQEKGKDMKKNVCRDFVRNSCTRGDSCKYIHPQKYIFCWDYQNGKCKRSECIFIHCSRDDEEYYHQSGELPPHLLEIQRVKKDIHDRNANIRANQMSISHNSQPIEIELEPLEKRRKFNCEQQIILTEQQTWSLEDENAFLRNMIASLKKKVEDLQAANEFLLEQNAQMRLNDKSRTGLTAVTVPAVITSAAQLPPEALRTVTASVATVPVSLAAVAGGRTVSLGTVSMAPVQLPPPSVSMSQPQGQQTTLSTTGPLISYPLVASSAAVLSTLTH